MDGFTPGDVRACEHNSTSLVRGDDDNFACEELIEVTLSLESGD